MGQGTPAERVPPHSQEAEVAVLGAILLEPKAMSSVATILKPDCFYRADHQKLYTAFTHLFDKNQPIDPLSVKEELRRMGAGDIAGNADLFMTLGGAVPSISNAEYYAQVIRQKYLLRSLITACNESAVEAYDEREEAGEILDRAEQRVFNVATRYEATHPVEIKEVVQQVVDTIMNHPERLLGIPTGYADLDRLTGGLHRGEFIVVGGRPSTGKTTFCLNLMRRIAVERGLAVLMLSLEMPREQITQNLLCSCARIDATPLRTGQLDKSQWQSIREAASVLYDSPVFLDDSAGLTCSEVRAKCRRLFAQHPGKIQLVIIDYLQLMTGERHGRDTTRLTEITDISRGLKGLAKELNVPVIALSQLSRAAEGEGSARPRLSHLRESGAIEQDADMVLLLYRPDPEAESTEDQDVTEVIIAKQRNGPTDTVKLKFLKNQMRFESWSPYAAAQVGAAPESPEPDPFEP